MARFDAVTERHPEAFSDHPARFSLVHNAKKALEMAKKNADTRATEASLDLVLSTAIAAGSKEAACEAATKGMTLPYTSEVFRSMVSSVASACPKDAR